MSQIVRLENESDSKGWGQTVRGGAEESAWDSDDRLCIL